jgi:hypothetical protein
MVKEISIPISDSCNCKTHFKYQDIVKLAIIPTIESITSVVTGAISNLDMFGMYNIAHFFVNFNYFTSVFHRSYEELIEYNLRRSINTSFKKKRQRIPYTLFSEPNGGIMKPVVNKKFIPADSFSFRNLLQNSYLHFANLALSYGNIKYSCVVFL